MLLRKLEIELYLSFERFCVNSFITFYSNDILEAKFCSRINLRTVEFHFLEGAFYLQNSELGV